MNHYRLTTAEREIIVTANDEERGVLHVFTESRSALATRLLNVARAIGAVVTATGAGIEFDLPVRCLSVRVPRQLTEAQRAQRQEVLASRHKPRRGAETPIAHGVLAPPASRVVSEDGIGVLPFQGPPGASAS